jgi:hypothetical protein
MADQKHEVDEHFERFKKALREDGMQIDAHKFATVEDCDAVLTAPWYSLNFMMIPDSLAEVELEFKREFQRWAEIYYALTPAQRASAGRSLLASMEGLKAAGYVALYGIYTTEDGYTVAAVLFGPTADKHFPTLPYLNMPRHWKPLHESAPEPVLESGKESLGGDKQEHGENDGTMMIQAHELLTVKDCDQIVRADGCLVGYAWPKKEKPSATMVKHMKKFEGTVRLTSSIYEITPEEGQKQWMCEGILHIVKEIAKEGYLTKYGLYTTEEQKRAVVVAFWPVQLPHHGEFQVPCRMADLIKQNFVRRKRTDGPKAAREDWE